MYVCVCVCVCVCMYVRECECECGWVERYMDGCGYACVSLNTGVGTLIQVKVCRKSSKNFEGERLLFPGILDFSESCKEHIELT